MARLVVVGWNLCSKLLLSPILGQRATIIWEGLWDHLSRKEIVSFKINVLCISLSTPILKLGMANLLLY
jgi:hypothetical protein